jgi:hypothetical protein
VIGGGKSRMFSLGVAHEAVLAKSTDLSCDGILVVGGRGGTGQAAHTDVY